MTEPSDSKTVWTIRDVLTWTTNYLKRKGCETPRLDAELLLAHNLGIERIRLYLDFDRPLSDGERLGFRDLVRRRALREPVALIIGKKEFWSLDIVVTPGVLIPRPETEILVQVVLEDCQGLLNLAILEVGCGSGAPLIAVSSVRPDIQLFACDISINSLNCASANASNHGFAAQIFFFASDLLESVRAEHMFDVIYSNPPYIPSNNIDSLAPEIRDFEFRKALDGGLDGLDLIRRLIPTSRDRLKPGGRLILEIGEEQFDSVKKLLETNGFSMVRVFKDLSGKNRVVKAVT
ncbi:MAG: peptide chain release factor N(5)-glutamine methyltransferase [Desulfomonilaceae bacterium]